MSSLEGQSKPSSSEHLELVPVEEASSRAAAAAPDSPSHGPAKRQKVAPEPAADMLPTCSAYEKSYMHRDVLSHVQIASASALDNLILITASVDGVVKFWKKIPGGIEFIRAIKSHTGPIDDLSINSTGGELVTVSRSDNTAKIFYLAMFDMINMLSLDFEPGCVEWIKAGGRRDEYLAISDHKSARVWLLEPKQQSCRPAAMELKRPNGGVVVCMRFHPERNIMIVIDDQANIEFARVQSESAFLAAQPPQLAELASEWRRQAAPPRFHSVGWSAAGDHFATTSSDRHVRVFSSKSGKLLRDLDESLERLEAQQREEPLMSNIDFARKMVIERELAKTGALRRENVLFDASGQYLLYPSMLGAKIVEWRSGRLLRSLGHQETNLRPLCLSLFQGLLMSGWSKAKLTERDLDSMSRDPTLFCSAYKRNRFYCFSNRYFEEAGEQADEQGQLIRDRDIFNEKPTREEAIAAVELNEAQKQRHVMENATIHTTMGDIHVRLHPRLAPKACENFCGHARSGYYNQHVFHRVVKGFMIQTGDPTATGAGGQSIWDEVEGFEDEFSPELRHDKPFVVSMANCGPNTNGSQFFITVAPCAFLDDKHTLFGQVVRGMDVCLAISRVKTNSKTDRPESDIKITNINVF